MSSNELPLWRQVSRKLVRRIDDGELEPGQRLPASRDLAEEFSVNRHTILRSIAYLQEKGLLHVEAGRRGTFVSQTAVQYRLGTRTQFEENLRDENYVPAREVLFIGEIEAPEGVTEALDLNLGETVTLVSLVGKATGVPINYGHHYFATRRIPAIAEAFQSVAAAQAEKLSISAAMQAAGIMDFRRKIIRIRARQPTAEQAQVLQIPKSESIIELRATNVDGEDRPIMCSSTCHASSRIEFVMEF